MSDYCRGYLLADLRRFRGWAEPAGERRPDDVCYLWTDLVVRDSALYPEQVLFVTDSPDWADFCRGTLGFEPPAFERPPCRVDPSEATGSPERWVPFTPGQRWMLEQVEAAQPNHRNPRLAIAVERRCEPAAAERALAVLLDCHEALRLRLGRVDGRWVQVVSDDPGVPLTWVSLAGLPAESATAARAAITVDAFHLVSRLTGPLLRFLYLEQDVDQEGDLCDLLAMLFSHVVADGISQFVLNSDLRKLLTQAADGEPPALAPAVSFGRWTEHVASHVGSTEAEAELRDYWLRLPWERVRPMPLDFPEGRVVDPVSGRSGFGTEASQRDVTVLLEAAETERLLRRATGRENDMQDFLLTALLVAFAERTGSPVLYLVDVDSNRQCSFADVDLSRTVGMMAQLRRILLDLGGAQAPEEVLATVRTQLRALPNRGRTLEWMLRRGDGLPVREELRGIPMVPALFTMYRGRVRHWGSQPTYRYLKMRGLEQGGQIPALDTVSLRCLRAFPLDFEAEVVYDQLKLKLTYSESVHRRETIESLAAACLGCLRDLVGAPAAQP